MVKINCLGDPVIDSLQDITEEVLSQARRTYGAPTTFELDTSTYSRNLPYQVWYRRLLMPDEDGFEFPIYVEGPHLWAIVTHSGNQARILPEYILKNELWYSKLTEKDYSCTNVFEALKTGSISGEYVKQLLQEHNSKDCEGMYFMGKTGMYHLQLCHTPLEKYECHTYRVGYFYSATSIRRISYQKS